MKPANNARFFIEDLVKEERNKRNPKQDLNKYFEFFVAEQILKDHQLTDDDIQSGMPLSKMDGGIDGLYLFCNTDFLESSTDIDTDEYKRIQSLELIITQCKYTDSLPDEIINRFISTMGDVLDYGVDIQSAEIQLRYHQAMLDTFELFRTLYRDSRSGVRIKFRFYVAHLSVGVPPALQRKKKQLEKTVKEHVREADVTLDFLGPDELLALVRKEPKTEHQLAYQRDIISPDEEGFICLVNLLDFYNFVHDAENNEIRENMFDANVRDYQGQKTTVNQEIAKSLQNTDTKIDFWWLNNGVTMVADKVTRRKDGLIIENPEIVNGLQTSYTIHSYFSENPHITDELRHILVRVVQLDVYDDVSRDLIIRATNSQTPIEPLLLHSTEIIHRNIEDFMRKQPYPLYYERRKNYYKNKGRKVTEIVALPALAQAVTAVLMRRPNSARTGVKKFFKNIQNYNLVFNNNYDIKMYYICALLRKRVEAVISSDYFDADPKRQALAKYILQHALMFIGIILTRNSEGPNIGSDVVEGHHIYAQQIAKIAINDISDDLIKESLEYVLSLFTSAPHYASPNSAKSEALVQDVIKLAKEQLRK